MKFARSLLLLVMLGATGCRLDGMLAPPREPGPISLAITVDFDDSDAGVLRVIANFQLPRGGGHRVLNDTMYVADSPMTPIFADPSGFRRYDAAWLGTSPTGSMTRVMVRGPAVSDTPLVSATQLAIYRRAGAAVILLGSGGLQLPLLVPSLAQPATWGAWDLTLRTADDAFIQVSGSGTPPNPLVISRSLLPPGSGDIRASLTILQMADASDDQYWLRTDAISRLYWTVRR